MREISHIGRAVAYRMFDQFPGAWRVELLMDNTPALRFWEPAVRAYLGTPPQVGEHDSPWGRMQVLRFSASARRGRP